MALTPLSMRVPSDLIERIDRARGSVKRTPFVIAALEEFLSGDTAKTWKQKIAEDTRRLEDDPRFLTNLGKGPTKPRPKATKKAGGRRG